MKKFNFQRLAQRSKNYLRKESPAILSCLGAVGVIATSALAVRATPKALHKIRADCREKYGGEQNECSKLEMAKSAWIYYVPAVATGTATIICIFGANVLNKHQQAALTGAYALLSDTYNNYHNKLREIYGEEAHQKIIDAIMTEQAKDVYISTNGASDLVSLSFGKDNPDEMNLFYDVFSRRYFEATISQVLEAEYCLNRNWALGANVNINTFYEFLGIEPINGGDVLGWYYEDGIGWIDFIHRKTILEDGLEVYIIDLLYPPTIEDDDA